MQLLVQVCTIIILSFVNRNLSSKNNNKVSIHTGSSASLIQNEQLATTESDVVCEDGVCRIRGNPSNISTSTEEKSTSLTAEEKVEKAKELIQKKKEEKEREEKEV